MSGLAFTGAPLPASGRVKATKTQSETIRARAKREPRVFPVCRLSECKWGTVPREDQPPAIPRVYNLDWSAELVFEDEPPRRWEAPPPAVPTSQQGIGRMDARVAGVPPAGSRAVTTKGKVERKRKRLDLEDDDY